MESNDQESIKSICIQGQNNRYQVRKCMREKRDPVKRKTVKESISLAIQKSILEDLYATLFPSSSKKIASTLFTEEEKHRIGKEIENKRSNYKQQDILKKRWNEAQFISFPSIIEQLHQSGMCCYFCQEEILLYYDFVREMKQWTLDRIDNNLGHNQGNVVIACLDCNLKKRQKRTDSFVFTKQMKLVKSD